MPAASHVYLRGPGEEVVRAPGLPFWRDHFAMLGRLELSLAAGSYSLQVEHGPEFRPEARRASIAAGKRVELNIELRRWADVSSEGWISGETHVHRPVGELDLLADAADLDVAQGITWWNRQNPWAGQPLPAALQHRTPGGRVVQVMGGEDEREGGALLFFDLPRPLAIQEATREYPSPSRFLREARRGGAWIDIEKPFWWDVPLWLAAGVDTIGLAHNHMHRAGVYEGEAWGRPRPLDRFPGVSGNGEYTQEIYARILEAGLTVAPSAGSASGVLPNPVGYNRVYAHTGVRAAADRSYQAWREAVLAGRSFVTNGPLLLARAAGGLPGARFRLPSGGELRIPISGKVLGGDPRLKLEIVHNGRVVHSAPVKAGDGERTWYELRAREPGWFLIRTVAENSRTYRFASTAPFRISGKDGESRASRAACRYFLEWIEERRARVRLDDPLQKSQLMGEFDAAAAFWRRRLDLATAD